MREKKHPAMNDDAAMELYVKTVESIHKRYDTTSERIEKGYDLWSSGHISEDIKTTVFEAVEAILEKRRSRS